MIFNSIEFMFFFPVVVLLYYILPHKIRYVWLLVTSCYFYMCWNPVYIWLLLLSTTVTYCAGIYIEYTRKIQKTMNKEKVCVIISLVVLLGILGIYKYFDFGLMLVNYVLGIFTECVIEAPFSLILPVGISFYTLQSIGYLIDVYRGDIYAEKNYLRYALFISFFPQLVAGPIERSKNLLVQLYRPTSFSWDNCAKGLVYMLWGYFLKIVIADRVAIIVNTVYESPSQYQGFFIVVAVILFAIQIYCDFYGYSTIARGAALILGISLMSNFEAPYFSRNIKEFWRRWHISLSGWFRDYLYIPLGGNRKGCVRKNGNLLMVFGISGLWHGASVAFILWGLLNGIYQVVGDMYRMVLKNKLSKDKDSFSCRLRQRIITFLLVCFTWLFFRAGDMNTAMEILENLFCFNWQVLINGSLFELGVSEHNFYVMIVAILLLAIVDNLKYRGIDVVERFMRQEWWFRMLFYVGMFFVILLFGCHGVEYDTSEFIYFQF